MSNVLAPAASTVLSKKQRKLQTKYVGLPASSLTTNIKNSWNRPVPPPLARHKSLHKIGLIALALVFAYFGTLIVASLYYLVFETTDTMNNLWHHMVPHSDLRHSIRDVGEGLLGGLLAQHIVRNRYKPLKPLMWYDKLEIRFHIANLKDDKPLSALQLLATPFLVLLYATPGFFGALGIIHLVNNNSGIHNHIEHFFSWLNPVLQSHLSEHGQNYLQKMQDSLVNAWPNKLSGFAAAFLFGRRPFKGVSDDVQLWLCQQRYLRYEHNVGKYYWYTKLLPFLRNRFIKKMNVNRTAPKYYPWNWQATYWDVSHNGLVSGVKYRELLAVAVIPVLLGAGMFFIIDGWYVLTIIAMS